MRGAAAPLRRAGSAFATVLGSRPLRRIELAFLGFAVSELATWVAILVFAYQNGGATEAGIVATVQLVPAAIVAPMAAAYGDRYRRDRFLLYGYVLQAVAAGAVGVLMLADAPVVGVYGAAVVAAASVTLTRPAHGSLVPLLVRSPEEVVAVNAVSGAIESASYVIGPGVAGLVMSAAGAGVVFVSMAAVAGASALLVAGVSAPEEEAPPEGSDRRGPLRQSVEGFGRLARQREAGLLVGLVASQSLVIGALDVLTVVLAIQLLHLGTGAPGLLTAALGVGGVLGSAAGFALIARRRLTPALALGAVLLGAPLAVIAGHPEVTLAAAMLALAGSGRVVMDVSGRTLLQRAVSQDLLSRAFGVTEGLMMAALALGSISASGLVAAAGSRGALLGAGLVLPALVAACWLPLRKVEARAQPAAAVVELMRRVPMFAPLPPLSLDRLATGALPVVVPAGTPIIREGEAGDRFYVLARGTAEVTVGGRVVGTLHAGDSFGEIALVRDVPRTASVVARTSALAYGVSRATFLRALTGHPSSRATADRVATERTTRAR